MYKTQNNNAPTRLQNPFKPTMNTKWNLRNSDNKLFLCKPRTECLKRAFAYNGAKLWNDLSISLKQGNNVSQVVCRLSRAIICQATDWSLSWFIYYFQFSVSYCSASMKNRRIDRQACRQTDRQTDRQIVRQTDRQERREGKRQGIKVEWYPSIRGFGRKSHFFEKGKIVAFSHLWILPCKYFTWFPPLNRRNWQNLNNSNFSIATVIVTVLETFIPGSLGTC